MSTKKQVLRLIAVSLLAGGLNTTQATELVYEPFDYADGTINGISSYGGGTGLTNTWEGSTSGTAFSMSDGTGHSHGGAGLPGLSFSGLSTTGSVTLTRKSAPGGAEVRRDISPDVLSSLMTDNTTIYFSALIRTKYYSVGNENMALVFGTSDALDHNSQPITSAGEAIGFALDGTGDDIHIQAITIDDGSTSVSGLGDLYATNRENVVFFILGEIQWGVSTDTINLYNVTNVNEELPTAFATLSANLDQSLFNTISIAGQQVSSMDEIRFALDHYGALGREAPPSAGSVFTFR